VFRAGTPTPVFAEVVYGTTFIPPRPLPTGADLRFVQSGNSCADGYYSSALTFRFR
jgi:hypothetical protein